MRTPHFLDIFFGREKQESLVLESFIRPPILSDVFMCKACSMAVFEVAAGLCGGLNLSFFIDPASKNLSLKQKWATCTVITVISHGDEIEFRYFLEVLLLESSCFYTPKFNIAPEK